MHRRIRPVIAAAAVLGAVLGLASPAAAAELTPASTDWLGTLNAYRATAGLGPVTANAAWAKGDVAHSRYSVLNGEIGHSEDPAKPGYTVEGDTAARSGNVMATSLPTLTPRDAIDMWMQGPFHAAGLLDPRLKASAYGQYSDPDAAKWRSAATMDVIRGIDGRAPMGGPRPWPGSGSGVPQGAYTGGEWPDPLTPCRGYAAPTGLPIVILNATSLDAHTVTSDGRTLESCGYDATGYTNPDPATRDHAVRGMSSRGLAIIIPREPLEAGSAYTVSATVGGKQLRWTFHVTAGEFVPVGGMKEQAAAPQPRIVPDDIAAACPSSMPEGGFADVSDRNVHRAAIDCVAWWEVAGGTSEGRYSPRGVVSRGQMASFLARKIRAAGVELPTGPDRFFDDAGSVHEEAINALANAGIADGLRVGAYAPSAPIGRGQMASLLVRSVEFIEEATLPAGPDRFEDDETSVHEDAINRAAAAGLASGTSDTTFAPHGSLGRDQMASLVARTLARLSSSGHAAPPA
ncbi:MAG: S-layer homology domain-containing protein [Actinobacteria bacterium]|nr:S-layer homology domain-containing protein [Actinomycetota bacterium]